MRKIWILGILMLSVLPAFAGRDIRLLIVTGGHKFEEKPFFEMFDSFPGVSYRHTAHPSAEEYFDPEKAGEFDVLVFYDMYDGVTSQGRRNLSRSIRSGQPVLVFHHAICGSNDWLDFINIAGGKYVKKVFNDPQTSLPLPRSSFKHDVDITVHSVEKNGVIPENVVFSYPEEVYYDLYIAPSARPLLLADYQGTKDNPVCWLNRYGKGSVITLVLGHDSQGYNHPDFREVLHRILVYLARSKK